MKIEKSLNDKLQETYEQAFELLYDKDNYPKEHTGLDVEVEAALWDYVEGIGEYIQKVLSGRMSLTDSLKDHIAKIETWEREVRHLIDKKVV